MTKNMSILDRRLRGFLVAPLLVIAAFLVGAGSVAGIVLFVLAAVMVATAATGYCPLYALYHRFSGGAKPLAQ